MNIPSTFSNKKARQKGFCLWLSLGMIILFLVMGCSLSAVGTQLQSNQNDTLIEESEPLLDEIELPAEELPAEELPAEELPAEELLEEELPPDIPPDSEGEEAESQDTQTLIIGTLWRLFEKSGPAGVAAAEVILSINGVDQHSAISRIDGLYLMEVTGIQPGDVLRLRAQAPQDDFEPLYYEWQAEKGVNRWSHDFFSYWEEITPPSSLDQNRIWGTVWDQFLGDVSGLYLNLQIGNSNVLERIGPTDEDGYFEALVTLPNRVIVTVWVDAPGFVPSQLMFFHAYEPENRELIFWRYRGENIQ